MRKEWRASSYTNKWTKGSKGLTTALDASRTRVATSDP